MHHKPAYSRHAVGETKRVSKGRDCSSGVKKLGRLRKSRQELTFVCLLMVQQGHDNYHLCFICVVTANQDFFFLRNKISKTHQTHALFL